MNIDDINDLLIKQARELTDLLRSSPLFNLPAAVTNPTSYPGHPFKIGANYFIRTVTFHHTGRLVEVTPTELVLEDAAWIADSGRFSDALKTSTFSEVEPFPSGRVIIGRGALIDAAEISTIPLSQK